MKAKWFLVFILLFTISCGSLTTPTAVFAPGASLTPTEQSSVTALPSTSTPVPTQTPVETIQALPSSTDKPSPSATTLVTPTASQPAAVEVDFIDVGQGDAILIRSPEGLFGLIDGGETNTGVVQYLQSHGVQNLDIVIATHPHSDHIGGLVEVLQKIPTARIVTNGQTYTTSVYENFLDAAIASKAEYIEVKRGDQLKLGSLALDVFSPARIEGDEVNHNSIVLRMVAGKTVFLFMGDADFKSEAEMLSAGLPLNADVLKVGHHSSNTSTSPAFLAAVSPAVAIYTAGKGNDYGFPTHETLSALSVAGAIIYGTDVNGTVVIDADETGYTSRAAKEGLPQSPSGVTVVEPTRPSAVQTPAPADVSINIVSLTSPISAGGLAQLTIKTAPGSACSITVYYKSGASQAAGLGPQTADASGQVTWSWKVGSRTTPGTWKIVVQSNLNGKTATQEIPFEVQ